MVVVADGTARIGAETETEVTSVLQTSVGPHGVREGDGAS